MGNRKQGRTEGPERRSRALKISTVSFLPSFLFPISCFLSFGFPGHFVQMTTMAQVPASIGKRGGADEPRGYTSIADTAVTESSSSTAGTSPPASLFSRWLSR